MVKKKKQAGDNVIAMNRKAHHDYELLERFEAGLLLEGWEVKSLRANRAQIKEAYVVIKGSEAFLINAHISPLGNIAAHVQADPTRSRKLLLHKREVNKLIGAVQKKGFTVVPLKLYLKRHLVKAEIAIGRGKKHYDKRETEKNRDWQRQQQRVMRKR